MKELILEAIEETNVTISMLIQQQERFKKLAEKLDIELESGRRVKGTEQKQFFYEVVRDDGFTDFGEIMAIDRQDAEEQLKKQFKLVKKII